jgi:hypothetical protein
LVCRHRAQESDGCVKPTITLDNALTAGQNIKVKVDGDNEDPEPVIDDLS